MEVEALSNWVTHILHAWIASRGDSHWVRLHMPSFSQIQWACHKKVRSAMGNPDWHVCMSNIHLRKLDMLPWKSVVLRAWETGTKPRTSHHWSSWGERYRKRKRLTIFFERMRKGHCQSGEHWNCFKWEKKIVIEFYFYFLLIVTIKITSQDKTELKMMCSVRTEHM